MPRQFPCTWLNLVELHFTSYCSVWTSVDHVGPPITPVRASGYIHTLTQPPFVCHFICCALLSRSVPRRWPLHRRCMAPAGAKLGGNGGMGRRYQALGLRADIWHRSRKGRRVPGRRMGVVEKGSAFCCVLIWVFLGSVGFAIQQENLPTAEAVATWTLIKRLLPLITAFLWGRAT